MNFEPTWVTMVEAGRPVGDLHAPPRPGGSSYRRAVVLVTVDHEPVGTLSVALDRTGRLSGGELRNQMDRALGDSMCVDPAIERAGWDDGDPRPMISVVICSRDRPDQLGEALDALLAVDYDAYEIVVVDNAPSDDQTATMVRSRFGHHPRVRYVREDVPGLSRARNRGLAEASGRFVAFTDDDIRVPPWWLRAIARGFRRAPEVVCVTGLVHPGSFDSAQELQFEQAVACTAKWGLDPRRYDLDRHRHESPLFPYQVGLYGGGGNSAFRVEFLRGRGGFDEALGAGTPAGGGEDLDAFLAVIAAGDQLAYEPAAVVWHLHRTDARALRRQTFGYGVGLGAFLTKTVLDRRHRIPVLARAGVGARYLLHPRSDKNVQKSRTYPWTLTALELIGIAYGPLAYGYSRRRAGARYRVTRGSPPRTRSTGGLERRPVVGPDVVDEHGVAVAVGADGAP